MANDILVAVVMLAIAIGWLLAKFPFQRVWRVIKYRSWRKAYMQGLRFLIDEESDQAIEQFIQNWDVNSENFDLHNALAAMLRKKGEVDRAITLHANLVAAKLPKAQLRLATFELAKDYIAAGLLDRAERLLINVVNHSKDYEEQSLELLQKVYQMEQDWPKAIAIAEQLLPNRRLAVSEHSVTTSQHENVLSHYYCEQAQLLLEDDCFKQADELLTKALQTNAQCSRAILLRAQLLLEQGQNDTAFACLEQLASKDSYLLVEALPLLERCIDSPEKRLEHLQQWLQDSPSVQIEKQVFKVLQEQSSEQAQAFLEQRLDARPTLQNFELFLNAQVSQTDGQEQQRLQVLQQLIQDVLKHKPSYHCHSCGFSGQQLHWLCPKCKSWGSIRRIRGVEGD